MENKPDIEFPEAKMPESFDSNFIKERVLAVLRNEPKIWERIRSEYADIKSLYLGYYLYLALIPFVVYTLLSLFSKFIPFSMAIVQFLAALMVPFVFAIVAEQVANRLESKTDQVNIMKLVIFSSTPMLLAPLFAFVHFLFLVVSLLALAYSIYLMVSAAPLFVTIKEGNGPKFWGFTIGLTAVTIMIVTTILSTIF